MKKLLFTFATLFVALSAAATVHPLLGFFADGNQVSEIEVVPGGDRVEVTINLTQDGYDAMQGVQLQWIVYNPERQPVSTVTFANFGSASRPKYFQPGTIHDALEWSTSASYLGDGSILRFLSKNDDGYPLLEGGEYNEYGSDASIWKIGFVAAADWADEYVTVELDPAGFQNVWSLPGSGSIDHEQTMVLKIKNPNYVPPTPQKENFLGTVNVTVDEAGKVVATYVPAEGETVPEDMEITVDPATVQPGTTEVTYTVTAEGYNDLTGTANVTYTPLAATPVITFTPGETGVTIAVEPCTSYEVIVNGVNKGQINFVEKDWVAQTIVVNAVNEPANYEPAYATDTYDLGVKDNYELAGYITIGAVDQSNGKVHVAYIGEEDVTLSVTMNEKREVITINAKEGDIQLPERGVVYEITATAIPVADHYNSLTSDVAERIWNELKVYEVVEPTVVGTQNDEAYVINVTNNDPYATVTLIVTLDGERTEYTDFPVTIPRTENDQYVSFYATATLTEAPAGYDDWTNASTNVQTDWIDALEQPEMKDFLGTVEVTVDENGNITAAYVPAQDEVVPEDMTITWDPTKVTESGTYTVNYTVKAEGYNDKTGSAQVTYTKPNPQPVQTNSPSVNKYNEVIWDAPHQCHNEYHISYTNAESDPDATIYYAVGVGTYDEATDTWTFEYQTDENGDTIYMEYVDELIYTTPGTYEITAYAIAPGKTASNTVVDRFTVASTTSVEELFADKTLAGVRYFNLAGQEMQEANGICISVYTFTDGTQVAVKVMQ